MSNPNKDEIISTPSLPLPSPSPFESAVKALLSPLHQATTKEELTRSARRRIKTIGDMRFYWDKIVAAEKQKAPLPRMIHITGTKGKGSTACMCEAILRRHGFSTGLFTSPHLIDIRERIRWNGRPIHPNIFGSVYWKIRTQLATPTTQQQPGERDEDDDLPKLPGYFRMLTLMAFYTFCCHLDVDVLIIEVGMGGRYDATNFLDDNGKRVCGVTLLDLDHTRILGNTLERIAWEKGGIFAVDKLSKKGTSPLPDQCYDNDAEMETSWKGYLYEKENENENENSKFFALDSNTGGVLKVLLGCARVEGEGGKLQLVDASGSDLRNALKDTSLGLAGDHQYGNATLAVHLCQAVVQDVKGIQLESPLTLEALSTASWPGRCQTVERHPFTFRLDGAHTPQSMGATMEWFRSKIQKSATSAATKPRVLVFTCSHERDPVELFQLIAPSRFTTVYFAKTDSSRPSPMSPPSATDLLHNHSIPVRPELLVSAQSNKATWQESLASVWNHMNPNTNDKDSTCIVRCNITAATVLTELSTSMSAKGDGPLEVLVTGSLYLVGSFLTAIDWNEESSPDALDL